jgi:NodT family efflux transporter outer membrane factor (OMF) lipoprotein
MARRTDMRRSLIACVAMACVMAGLGGCRVGPDYAGPAPVKSVALQSGQFLRAAAIPIDPAPPPAQWWRALGDPQLDALVEKALADAPDVAEAQAHLRQARASLHATRAAQLPSVDPSITYIHAQLPGQAFGTGQGGTDIYNVGFDASWEIDLWGAKHRKVEHSRAEAQAVAAQLAEAQVSLAAEVVRTYIALRAAEARLPLLDRRLASEQHEAEFARQRFTDGATGREPYDLALDNMDRMQRERVDAQAQVLIVRDALAVLTGDAPGALDALPGGAVPLPPARVEIGDPAGLLARRPDIRAAERQLAAATAQIGVEDARRFPSVSLLGLVGIGGNSPGDVFDGSELTAIAVPRLNWKFLDFGQIAAARHGAEAAADAARAQYRRSVLTALQDAESALVRYGANRRNYGFASETRDRAARNAALDDQRARAGAISSSAAIAANGLAIDAELGALDQRAELTTSYVALAKALGVGWDQPPAKPL